MGGREKPGRVFLSSPEKEASITGFERFHDVPVVNSTWFNGFLAHFLGPDCSRLTVCFCSHTKREAAHLGTTVDLVHPYVLLCGCFVLRPSPRVGGFPRRGVLSLEATTLSPHEHQKVQCTGEVQQTTGQVRTKTKPGRGTATRDPNADADRWVLLPVVQLHRLEPA